MTTLALLLLALENSDITLWFLNLNGLNKLVRRLKSDKQRKPKKRKRPKKRNRKNSRKK